LAQAGVDATACATVYLVGGAFFSTGGYTSVLQVVNEPEGGWDAAASAARWRWWSREARPPPPPRPSAALAVVICPTYRKK
jgi:hypothetical protein